MSNATLSYSATAEEHTVLPSPALVAHMSPLVGGHDASTHDRVECKPTATEGVGQASAAFVEGDDSEDGADTDSDSSNVPTTDLESRASSPTHVQHAPAKGPGMPRAGSGSGIERWLQQQIYNDFPDVGDEERDKLFADLLNSGAWSEHSNDDDLEESDEDESDDSEEDGVYVDSETGSIRVRISCR